MNYQLQYDSVVGNNYMYHVGVPDGRILLQDEEMMELVDLEIPGLAPFEIEQRDERLQFLEHRMYEELIGEVQELAELVGGRLNIIPRDEYWMGCPVYEAIVLSPM